MQTQHSHWLIDWPEKNPPTLDDLAQSNLASIRLRTVVAQRSILRQGWQISQGEKIYAKPTVVFIGKIGGRNIEQRTIYWLQQLEAAKASGCRIIMDYTDHHLGYDSPLKPFYAQLLKIIDRAVCSSDSMALLLKKHFQIDSSVIPDLLEIEPRIPKKKKTVGQTTALWFGHSTNIVYLIEFIKHKLKPKNKTRIIVLTNEVGISQIRKAEINLSANLRIEIGLWSIKNMLGAAMESDACIIPSNTNDIRKMAVSNNRLITAIALGLPVAATMLSSYREFSSYIYNIDSEGINDFLANPNITVHRIVEAQNTFLPRYRETNLMKEWAKQINSEYLNEHQPFN